MDKIIRSYWIAWDNSNGTDDEKAKYTEQQAEKRLTQLIYREIYSVKGVA